MPQPAAGGSMGRLVSPMSIIDLQNCGGRTIPANARGDRTRDRLLDALEAIAATAGIGALSHRAVARQAQLNAGLIHYHFGTLDQLLEGALARRAARLSRAQLSAISQLMARGNWTVDDIVAALWQPFSVLGSPVDGGWRNYLCLIARLSTDERGDELLRRHFDDVMRAAHRALRFVLPDTSDELIGAGLRFTRTLFEQEAQSRCRKEYATERRAEDDRRLVAYASAGLRELARPPTRVAPLRMSGIA